MTRRALIGAAGAATLAGQSAAQLHEMTMAEAAAAVAARRVSPVELTRACLERIEKHNPRLNCFITVMREQALGVAREREAEQMRGRLRGPLHGIPIGLKDLIDTAGVRTTAASSQYASRVPEKNAFVVEKLRNAGAVIVGKLNMDEFAYNFTSETSQFGPVPNPWNARRIPGGSSGGSAAAVAARLCFGALGSDTGGSIRLPAALCGIVGLKPTHGRVSVSGVVPLAWSLDHLGPMCRGVEAAAMMLGAMAGYDAGDANCLNAPVPDYAAGMRQGVGKLRIGVPREIFQDKLDGEIAASFGEALRVIGKLAAGVKEVVLPRLEIDPAVGLVKLARIVRAEAYAFHEEMFRTAPEKYHAGTRASIELGGQVKAADYARDIQDLRRLRHEVQGVFRDVDLLITPVASRQALAMPTGGNPDLVMLRNTMPFNVYGIPVLSVPCGFTNDGMPMGLQIAGPALGESRVLALGYAYERATEWHRRVPPE
jgi:aspartyl-tRNA(Asn)/glutamyl-tRNA(Gln) amidotransferase subunit A